MFIRGNHGSGVFWGRVSATLVRTSRGLVHSGFIIGSEFCMEVLTFNNAVMHSLRRFVAQIPEISVVDAQYRPFSSSNSAARSLRTEKNPIRSKAYSETNG